MLLLVLFLFVLRPSAALCFEISGAGGGGGAEKADAVRRARGSTANAAKREWLVPASAHVLAILSNKGRGGWR